MTVDKSLLAGSTTMLVLKLLLLLILVYNRIVL